jgi:solute carrier family 35 protein E1
MKFANLILILASVLTVTAFSLERRAGHAQVTRIGQVPRLKTNSFPARRTTTSLLEAERTSEGIANTVAAAETKPSLLASIWNENTKLSFYLLVWYMGNIYYNVCNKKACNALGKSFSGANNAVWALSAMQLLVGVLCVLPLWITGIRPAPKMTLADWKEMAPVGIWAAMAHSLSVLALSAGAVSFGQIVKAGEPVFAAATNAFMLGDYDHPMVYLTLLPIIGGVAVATVTELSFTWTALIAASAANQAAAFKNVVSKGVMNKPWAKNLGPQNFYTVVTILALLASLPLVLIFDAKEALNVYNQVMEAGTGKDVLLYTFLSGLTFYLYNEASFLALERLSPVTHSVANTLKRVVIIVASCLVFNAPITLTGAIGSATAILGTLLYSLAKKKYHKKH